MSKRKEKTNRKLEILNEINQIDKRLKRFKNNANKDMKNTFKVRMLEACALQSNF